MWTLGTGGAAQVVRGPPREHPAHRVRNPAQVPTREKSGVCVLPHAAAPSASAHPRPAGAHTCDAGAAFQPSTHAPGRRDPRETVVKKNAAASTPPMPTRPRPNRRPLARLASACADKEGTCAHTIKHPARCCKKNKPSLTLPPPLSKGRACPKTPPPGQLPRFWPDLWSVTAFSTGPLVSYRRLAAFGKGGGGTTTLTIE